MIKAVFFDVDGTLISHTISDIPQNTLDALDRLRRSGVLLFVATGRHISELERLPLHDYPFDGYVTQTGQICYDRDFHPVYRNPISGHDAEALSEYFQKKTLPLVLVNDTTLYINYVNDVVRETQKSIHTPVPEIGEYHGEDLYGATVFAKGEALRNLMDRLTDCKESSWHDSASDIVKKSSGKVDGIKRLLEYFGIGRNEVMAFGDADNDCDMIGYAHVGVAMGNGTERLKEMADYVTASVDDNGIGKALARYGLI